MIPKRVIQVLIVSISYLVIRLTFSSISMAVLAMTNKDDPNHYSWTTTQLSLILNVGFVSITLVMVPSNYLPKILSYRMITFLAIFSSGVAFVIIPFIASVGWWSVCLLRIIGGMTLGAFLPLAHNMAAKWAPAHERTRIMLILSCGAQLGNILGTSLSGVIIKRLGWEYIFIILGTISCVWAFVPASQLIDSPENHPHLPDKERALYHTTEKYEKNNLKKFTNPPWLKIMTSPAVWAITIVILALEQSSMILHTQFPLFLSQVIKLDTQNIGFLISLSTIISWILSFPFCYLADCAIQRGLPISIVRKTFTTLSLWGDLAVLVMLCYAENSTYIIVLMMVSAFCRSAMIAGCAPNSMDISPNFNGSVHSFVGLMSSPNFVIDPLIWAYIVTNTANAEQWHRSFVFTAIVLFVASVVYLIFAEGKPQEWDTPKPHSGKKTDVIEAVVTKK